MGRTGIVLAIGLLAVVGGAVWAEPSDAPLVQRFLGINQSGDWDGLRKVGIGWERSHIEPNAGWPDGPGRDFSFGQYDKKVLDARARGITLLPILAYSVPWAAPRKSYSFDYKGMHYIVLVRKDDTSPNGYTYLRIGKDPRTGKEVSRADVNPGVLAPRRELWEAYVERLVSHYSKPPFSIKYWQIWNEGMMESGAFWGENVSRYVDEVHIPAAKIIRKHGCKVVWGGWPDCNSLAEYDQALEYHEAWKYTDILDVHYLPPVALDYLYRRWIDDGRCEGIWMTEIGFTQNSDQVANTYPRMFHWALDHGLRDPDRYKAFWFAWWSPNDPKAYGYKCCAMSGDELTGHGTQMAQFARLLSGRQVTTFKGVRTDPALSFSLSEREGSIEGFQVDDRYVFALHIPVTSSGHWVDPKTGDSKHMGMSTMNLTLKGKAGTGFSAKVIPLTPRDPHPAEVTTSGHDLIVTLKPPISPGESCSQPTPTERTFYVVVERGASTPR